jgi:translation elongation factor aEF-1 beta
MLKSTNKDLKVLCLCTGTKIYKTSDTQRQMATVIFIVKLMPDSPDADLKAIENTAKSRLEPLGATNITFEEKPIAFGLKAIYTKFAMPEEKGSDEVENQLSSVEHVSSATIEDYRRAFG